MSNLYDSKEDISRMWQEAEFYERQGLHDHAVLVYQSILKKEPDDRKAQAKIVQIKFSKRVENTTESRKTDSDELSPRLALDLGIAYMGMNLYTEALEEFKRAFKNASPFKTEILRYTATCLMQMHKYDEAHKTIERLISDDVVSVEEKGDIIAEALPAYIDHGLLGLAQSLISLISDEEREHVKDYSRLLEELSSAAVLQQRFEVLVEDTDTGEQYTEPIDDVIDDATPGEIVHIDTEEDPEEPSIPLRTTVSYSTDNKNWRNCASLEVSATWAMLEVRENIEVGNSLVLQIQLPASENERVWVVSRVIQSDQENSGPRKLKVEFVSFLPGGETLLKNFMDEVVENPDTLTKATLPQLKDAPDALSDSADVFASLEQKAIRHFETALIDRNEIQNEKTGETTTELSRIDPDMKRERTPKIRFACECGQVHVVPVTTVGRKGKCGACGRSMVVPVVDMRPDSLASQMVGKIVGGCRLLYKIGGGGMGGVFKGHHIALDIPVAVKILHAHLAEKDPVFIKRFIREARSAAKLQHPNIVGVMNVGFENGLHYLIMPFVGGGSAASVLARNGRFSLEKVLDIALEIAMALSVAEEQGMLHRDIKPANILFTTKGEAMLADLGLAKNYLDSQDSGITQTGIACGTPLYFSPEQAKGTPNIDVRSDIYSLGITLYHLLEGSPPFKGESAYVIFQKHVHEPLPPFKEAKPPISEEVFKVLEKMTAKNPDERYRTAVELLNALESLRKNLPNAGKKSSPKKGLLARLGIRRSS